VRIIPSIDGRMGIRDNDPAPLRCRSTKVSIFLERLERRIIYPSPSMFNLSRDYQVSIRPLSLREYEKREI
jgi:hypothetical protein